MPSFLIVRRLCFTSCHFAALFLFCVVGLRVVSAEPVPAIHVQGSMHGFLLLKSAEGKVIAVGDEISVAKGNQVHSRLTFHFRDGSIDDETTVFKQASVFQLVSDRHVQKGPSFPEPLDLAVNVPAGEVTWREMKDGKQEVKSEHMDLPPDLANGLMSLVVQNFPQKATEMKVSYLAGSSKPRLVKLSVKPDGEESFRVGGTKHQASRFNLHVEIGGVTGVIAPVVGKQPTDIKIWVIAGEVPSFIKMEGAFYQKGPIWTMELTSPVWPQAGK